MFHPPSFKIFQSCVALASSFVCLCFFYFRCLSEFHARHIYAHIVPACDRGFVNLLGMAFQQGSSSSWHRLYSLRLLCFTLLIYGFLFVQTFSAGLASSISVRILDDTINSLGDVAASNYDIYVQGGSSLSGIFSKAQPGTVEHTLWQRV